MAETNKNFAGRYDYFKVAKDWLEVLKYSEEGKGLTPSELINKAMDDIVSGRVTEEEVIKRKSKLKPVVEQTEDLDKLESLKKSEKSKK